MIFAQLDIVCPSKVVRPWIRMRDEHSGIAALVWCNGDSALVTFVDRRRGNEGCSVTNAAETLIALIYEQVLEYRAIPWCNVRWMVRDSDGYFDHIHVIEWPENGYPKIEFAPCGDRGAVSFKNYVKTMGFVVDHRRARQMQALFDRIDHFRPRKTA